MMTLSTDSCARNGSDMKLFLCLMALCDALLPSVADRLLLRWSHLLMIEIISLSSRLPHISGFYKLIRILVVVCERCDFFAVVGDPPSPHATIESAMEVEATAETAQTAQTVQTANATRCYSMLSGFLTALQERTARFKDELLVAAMDLLLCAPLRFVRSHMPSMISILEAAFATGHAYRPLALTALTALESWLESLRSELSPHLTSVLPCLHVYLSLSADKQARLGTVRAERKDRRTGTTRISDKNQARTRLTRGEDETLQLRIVGVLGRIGGDCVGMVQGSERTPMAEGRWSLTDHIDFKMCLTDRSDSDMPVYLDAILPRVAELATSSMSYREKAAACELLEAAIKLTIGHANRNRQGREALGPHFERIFPAMLKLSTDADGFARKLFEPLTKQVIRWLTSAGDMGGSSHVSAMLEAIMIAVADHLQSGLREFAAQCLGEFIKYSIRAKLKKEDSSPLKLHSLLHRLYGLAHHPSALHRLGFAYALNSPDVYRELREDADTMNEHLLELLQRSLFALRLAEADPPALDTPTALGTVVTHLEQMLIKHQKRVARDPTLPSLLQRDERRDVFPEGLMGPDGFLHWLFAQCVQPKAQARLRCSKLFETLCPLVPARSGVGNCKNSAEWVHAEFGPTHTHGHPLHDLPLCARFRAPSAVAASSAASGGGGRDTTPNWSALGQGPKEEGEAAKGDEAGGAGGDEALVRWLEQVQAALDLVW